MILQLPFLLHEYRISLSRFVSALQTILFHHLVEFVVNGKISFVYLLVYPVIELHIFRMIFFDRLESILYPDHLRNGLFYRLVVVQSVERNYRTAETARFVSLHAVDFSSHYVCGYLADYIEPSRDFPGVDKLRSVCYKDLNEGLLLGLEMTIREMTDMGNPVHRATLEARDALKG